KIVRKKDLWSGANRYPPVPAIRRIAAPRSLINNDRHDGELVVRLNKEMFCDPESFRTLEKRSRVVDRRTKVTGCSLSVLDGKPVVTTVPFQTLMTDTERVSVWNGTVVTTGFPSNTERE